MGTRRGSRPGGGIVVASSVRLPKSLGGTLNSLLLEVEVEPETSVCQRCRVTPDIPLLQALLQELVLGRPLAELPQAADEFTERYRGPLQKAASAALRNLPGRFEQADGD